MKKNTTLKRLVMTALAIMMITLMIPASVFAATKSKRIKSEKYYNADGKLQSQSSYKYDKHGNIVKYVDKYLDYDYETQKSFWRTNTATYTRKYYANGAIKKSVTKYSDGDSYTSTYDSNGHIKKSVSKNKSNGKTVTRTTTYKVRSNGLIKSSTTKEGKKVISKTTYGSNGRMKKRVEYNDKGKVARTVTYSYKTSKGRTVQETQKASDGTKYVYKYKYDKKGRQTMWGYTDTYKDYNGKTQTYSYKETYKYKTNKDGTINTEYIYDKDGKLKGRRVYTYTKKKYKY